MSLHKSLKTQSALVRARSVLTRGERLERLRDDGRWGEEQSVFGLPKVKTFRPKVRRKAAKKAETETEEETPVEG